MKTAIITGCNRGIGAGIRDVLLKEGYFVYGLNRTPAKVNNKRYKDVSCDVSKKAELKKAMEQVKSEAEKIDVLIPNAAIRCFEDISKLPDGDWEASVNTNLNSVFYLTKAFVPELIKSKGYCIIIGSHAEKYNFAQGSAYCATKAALRAFSECLLEEVRHKGVKVTYLSIGSVRNRDHGFDESWKLLPEHLGNLVVNLLKTDERALASYVDFRPAHPLVKKITGIQRLQYL
jgi:NAD(P)-dependent dehydrogenase (short-subunit alcohol dehydrogenase family)